MHPGLSMQWGLVLWGFMIFTGLWAFWNPVSSSDKVRHHLNISSIPVVGHALSALIGYVARRIWVLFLLRLFVVGVFLLIIYEGLFGTPFPQYNAATVLTWNLWWTCLLISIFFAGSLWCGLCPWNTIANWIVNRKNWIKNASSSSLSLRVPRWLKTIWPAFFLLIGLTWLELGVGIVIDPFGTAILALTILVASTTSLMLFERNAFCHYFCPVGRTVGAYAQLAPVELRPIDNNICATCTTLECYHDPQLIAKYQRRFPGFDEKIISMYARGMSNREIVGHLHDLYGVDVSPDLISVVTDAVLEEVAAWQARPLEAVYPIVFFDALRVKIRDEGFVRNKAVHIAA